MAGKKFFVIMQLIYLILGMTSVYFIGKMHGRNETIDYLLYCKNSEFTITRKEK